MTSVEMNAEVERRHAEKYPQGCRPAPDWCEACAARIGITVREAFARIRRNRACYRCGSSPEHCECPDQMDP